MLWTSPYHTSSTTGPSVSTLMDLYGPQEAQIVSDFGLYQRAVALWTGGQEDVAVPQRYHSQ